MSFLRVRNWEHYQNADIFKKAKGKPPWVKLYTAMLDDRELLALDLPTQLLFDRLLLLAAKHANAIPNDSEWIANQISMERGHVVKGCAKLLKGAWLRETKTTRDSRIVRETFSPRSRSRSRKNPLSPLKNEKLEALVRNGGFEYTDNALREELVAKGADDLLVAKLLRLAAELRAVAS